LYGHHPYNNNYLIFFSYDILIIRDFFDEGKDSLFS